MSNNFSVMPIRVDTVMGSTYQNSSPVNSMGIRPKQIHWVNPTTVGHTFVIQDAAGNTIYTGVCDTASKDIYYPMPENAAWPDFKVSTLSSGVLYIYF